MKTVLEAGHDYIDHCVHVVAQIDPEELSQRTLGSLLGKNERLSGAPTTRVYSLGQVSVDGCSINVAYKAVRNPENRLTTELRDITTLLSRVPDFFGKFPYFLGAIGVEGASFPAGIITEDATRGETVKMFSTWMNGNTYRAIADACGEEVPLHEETLKIHSTFNAGGVERILDLSPSIFGLDIYRVLKENEELGATHDKARDARDSVTIQIAPGSALAQSIPA